MKDADQASPSAVARLLSAPASRTGRVVVLDIRDPAAYERWRVAGAHNMAMGDGRDFRMAAAIGTDPPEWVIIYCYSGIHFSPLAANFLKGGLAEGPRKSGGTPRVVSVRDGAFGLRAMDGMPAVRRIPLKLAKDWTARGAATILPPPERPWDKSRLLPLKRRLTKKEGPLTVIQLDGRGADELALRLAEMDEGRGPGVPSPLFAVRADHGLARPGPFWVSAGLLLRRAFGGPWRALWVLLAVQAILLGALRRFGLGRVLAGEERRRHRLPAPLIAMGMTIFIAGAFEAMPEFYGVPPAVGRAPLLIRGGLWLLALFCGFWLSINNPATERNRRLVERLRRLARGEDAFRPPVGLMGVRRRLLTFNLALLASGALLYLISFSLNAPTLTAITVSLYLPSAVDCILYAAWRHRLRRSADRPKRFLDMAGIAVNPGADADTGEAPPQNGRIRIRTWAPGHPGRFRVETREWTGMAGAFTSMPIPAASHPFPTAAVETAARVRRLLNRDVTVDVFVKNSPDAAPVVAAVGLTAPAETPEDRLHHRLMRAMDRWDKAPKDHPCLDAAPFAEAVDRPTPLTLEMMRRRRRASGPDRASAFSPPWGRADGNGMDMVCLAGRVYQNRARRAVRSRLLRRRWFIRVLGWAARLHAGRLFMRFYLTARPAALKRQRRLEKWLNAPLSGPRLATAALAGLDELAGKSARDQDRIAMAHLLLHQLLARGNASPGVRRSFRRMEALRGAVRDAYLGQLDVAARLLARLGTRCGVGPDIVFLKRDEIPLLTRPSRRPWIMNRIGRRKTAWREDHAIALPDRLTVADLENLVMDGSAAPKSPLAAPPDGEWRGVRVSGLDGPVECVVRVLKGMGPPPDMSRDLALVTRHADPAWMGRLASAGGLVSEGGGILCHAAILARELGLPAIMAATGASDGLRDGDRIRMMPDGRVQRLPRKNGPSDHAGGAAS